jgi:hypothetical protein
MNKYTFNWNITPATEGDYALKFPPFEVVARGNTLALTTAADAADEQRVREQADEVAHNLARSLSCEHGERFEVKSAGYHVLYPTGQQSVSISVQLTVKPAVLSGSVDFDVCDATGNVIDSSALRREKERQAAHQRITDLTRRSAADTDLRDMLDHWSRYAADTDGRLHPLYDVLQVVERLYGGRRKAASALSLSDADLSDLGRIGNDPTMLNGRHPGKAPGPHRIASEAEVATCERVAKAIIENYASKVVL